MITQPATEVDVGAPKVNAFAPAEFTFKNKEVIPFSAVELPSTRFPVSKSTRPPENYYSRIR